MVLTAATAVGLVAALLGPQAEASGPAAPTMLTGTVVHVMPDRFGTAEVAADPDEVLTFVATPTAAVPVASDALAELPTGTEVQVEVAPEDVAAGAITPAAVSVVGGPEAARAADGPTRRSGVSTSVAATTADHEVMVVVADLPGRAKATVTAAQVAATVNGGVRSYWSTVTGGRVAFHATAYAGTADGHIRTTSSPCDGGSAAPTVGFWKEVADRVGFRDGPGRHLLVYFRNTSACGGIAGLATLSGDDAGGDLAGGGTLWTNGYNTVSVIGHELGHNLGLGHSQELRCGNNVDAGLARCSKLSYNDLADIMGVSWGNNGFLNAVHLMRLGLLPPGDVVDVTDSRTLTLRPMSTGSGPRVARLRSGGATYLVEARAKVGTDDWLGGSYGRPGVTIRKVLGRDGLSSDDARQFPARESLLLDGDPGTSDALTAPKQYRTVLPVDRWIPLAGDELAVRVRDVGRSGSVVRFRVGSDAADSARTKARKAHVSRAEARLRTGALSRGRVIEVPSRWTWSVTKGGRTHAKHSSARGSVRAATAWRSTTYAHKVRVAGAKLTVRGKARAKYLPESTADFSGGWRKARSSSAFGHRERVARSQGSTATFTVRGRSIGVVARTAPHRGRFAVLVDGARVGTATLSGHRHGTPRVVWRTTLSRGGKHTVQLVRIGTKRAAFDGLVTLR